MRLLGNLKDTKINQKDQDKQSLARLYDYGEEKEKVSLWSHGFRSNLSSMRSSTGKLGAKAKPETRLGSQL